MARFGTWAPLASNWAAQPRLTTPDIICLHTMVGSLAGTDAMFRRNGFGGTFSHFGVGGDGSCTQWQDTAFRAAANYNGNHRIISVECADLGAPFSSWNTNDGSAVPAFSDAQLETLAHLIATIAPAHDIPIALIPDAKPGRRGIGYHRLGVPGYMAAGAEQWSTAVGKVCPGNRRIAQIPQVIAAALGGHDMPLTQQDIDAIWHSPGDSNFGPTWISDRIIATNKRADDMSVKLDALSGAVAKLGQGSPVNVDPAALAAALLADEASVAKLGDAIAAGLAKRVGNG